MKSQNKKRLALLSILMIIFIAVLIILIVVWSRSNTNELSASYFWNTVVTEEVENNILGDESKKPVFKGKTIESFTANESVGANTVVISGTFTLEGNSKVSYSTQFSKNLLTTYDQTIGDYFQGNTKIEDKLTSTQGKLHLLDAAGTQGEGWAGKPSLTKRSTVDRDYVPAWETAIFSILPWVLFLGITGFIFMRMMKAQGGAGGLSIFNAGKNKARKVISKVKFTDVAGIEEEKDELIELVDYLKNPQKYSNCGARVPKGVLLEGPPGTGKTLLAKAVSGEAGVPFYSISGSEFEEIFVGVGASRIREMFADAKKTAPCIIFIDEIDAVGRKRMSSFGGATNEQTLNQLLVELDGFDENSGIIVIAATNMVDILDPALLRPGRFDRKIQIALPDLKSRVAILKLHARNKNISSSVDFERLAQRTPGFSGAQLENVLNEATILAVRNNTKVVTLEIIDEAIDRVIGGPAKKSKQYTIRDKNIVSYHEAGHALIGMKVASASKVQKVTIIPRGSAGGYTIVTPNEEIMFHSREHLMANITGFLGGRASEEIKFGKDKITTGAHDDLEKATYTARHMVTEFGMSSLGLTQYETRKQAMMSNSQKMYSESLAKSIDDEVNKILNECYEQAKKVINENQKELALIASALFIMETITSEDIEYIDKNMKLPPRILTEKQRQEEHNKKVEEGDILDIMPDEKA